MNLKLFAVCIVSHDPWKCNIKTQLLFRPATNEDEACGYAARMWREAHPCEEITVISCIECVLPPAGTVE